MNGLSVGSRSCGDPTQRAGLKERLTLEEKASVIFGDPMKKH